MIAKYENHEAADAFPMMDAKRFEELKASIAERGLRHPITLCDGKILDGRNRYKACVELGVEPRFVFHKGNPWSYAWDCNGERRDLLQDVRSVIYVLIWDKAKAWEDAERSVAEAANEKRREAAKAQHAVSTPRHGETMVVDQNDPPPKRRPIQVTRNAKAAAAKTSPASIARAEYLIKEAPDLVPKVVSGEMKPTDARREVERRKIVTKLESVEAIEAKAASGLYDVIVMDPPWAMEKIERDEYPNQVAFDYPTMTEDELRGLSIPAASDCHLWCWTTQKFLPMSLRLLNHWGFRYVCMFTWLKPGGFQPFGLPQFNTEFAVYARKGSPKFIDTKAFFTGFTAPRGKHSEKPEEFYEVVRRVTAGRRLDMFNRRAIAGFDGWGKEAVQ